MEQNTFYSSYLKSISKSSKSPPLDTTLKILNHLEKGENIAETASQCKTDAAIVRKVKIKSDDIKLKLKNSNPTTFKVVKYARDAVLNNMEKVLVEWIRTCENDADLRYPNVKSKALEIFDNIIKNLNQNEGNAKKLLQEKQAKFSASKGWYNRFKKRHNLSLAQNSKEKMIISDVESDKKELLDNSETIIEEVLIENMNYRKDDSMYASSTGSVSNGSPMSLYSNSESSPDTNRYILLEMSPRGDISNAFTQNANHQAPYLEILEQPSEKFRFRYLSELSGTHGSLMAKGYERGRKKVYPTVELKNYSGHAIVSCSLYQTDVNNRTPHSHLLVLKGNLDEMKEPHYVDVDEARGYKAVFPGMGIIHTAKKFIAGELYKKLRRLEEYKTLKQKDELELKSLCAQIARHMNLNSVCLCFEAFDANTMKPICKKVFSSTINNMKSALTGDLKICRLSRYISSVQGGDEVFLFVEKVGKKNIKVKFYELDEDDQEIWCDYGKFGEFDVHHQYAIALTTPPYRDQNITKPKECFIQLLRPSDNDVSEPLKFIYNPSERTLNNERKRIRIDPDYNSDELINILPTTLRSMQLSTEEFQSGECASLSAVDGIDIDEMHSDEFRNFMKDVRDLLVEENSDFGQQNLALDCRGGSKEIISSSKLVISDVRTQQEIQPATNEKMLNYLQLKKVNDDKQDIFTEDRSTKLQTFNDFEVKHQLIMLLKKIKDPTANNDTKMKSENEASVKKLFLTGENGNTVLHKAVELDEMNIARDMLDLLIHCNLCDLLNTKNDFGKSILHKAIEKEKYIYIKPLLAAGLNANITDDNGNTPLHVAVQTKSLNAVKHLLNSKSKILVNELNNDGRTALHLAAANGHKEIITKLLDCGANLNETEALIGNTALHIAVHNNQLDAVKVLISNEDIQIDSFNRQGHTPLHLACVGNEDKNSLRIIDLLLQANADPFLPMNNLKTEKRTNDDDEEDDQDETFKRGDAFELAASKPEVLKILEKHSPNAKHAAQDLLKKLDEADRFYDASDLDVVEIKTEPSDSCSFDEETVVRLSKILDKSGNWENVAEMLGYTSLMSLVDKRTQSPSRVLLGHIEESDNLSFQTLIDILQALDEGECVKIIESMVFRVLPK